MIIFLRFSLFPECPYPVYSDATADYCWFMFDTYTTADFTTARTASYLLDQADDQISLAVIDTLDKHQHLLSSGALEDVT